MWHIKLGHPSEQTFSGGLISLYHMGEGFTWLGRYYIESLIIGSKVSFYQNTKWEKWFMDLFGMEEREWVRDRWQKCQSMHIRVCIGRRWRYFLGTYEPKGMRVGRNVESKNPMNVSKSWNECEFK